MTTKKLTAKQEKFCQQYVECLNVEEAATCANLTMAEKPSEGFYVYLLVNPLTETIFYVGKGKGSRAFDHQKLLPSDSNNVKKAVITEIKKQGRSVKHLFFATGLEEVDAFSIEGQLIKRFKSYGLTNISSGVVTAHENMIAAARELRDNIVACASAGWVPHPSKAEPIEDAFGSIEGYYTYMLTSIDWILYGEPKNPEFKGRKKTLQGIIENARIKNQKKSSLSESVENV